MLQDEGLTSLSRIAPRLNKITLRMTTTDSINMGKTAATAILQHSA